MCEVIWTWLSIDNNVLQTTVINEICSLWIKLGKTFSQGLHPFLLNKGTVRWNLGGSISSGYLIYCPLPFFMSIRIEFSASYSILSQSLVTPTLLVWLFINPEFSRCPLRRSCQLQLFWYLPQTACFCYISLYLGWLSYI